MVAPISWQAKFMAFNLALPTLFVEMGGKFDTNTLAAMIKNNHKHCLHAREMINNIKVYIAPHKREEGFIFNAIKWVDVQR